MVISRKLALNSKNIKNVISIALLFTFFLFSACSPTHKNEVDELNKKAYSFHYRNIDSTWNLSKRAFSLSNDYGQGKAEALNNLAFVCIIRMRYAEAYKFLYQALDCTDNQIELLISDIQLMRLCQRQSKNKDFYGYRERALSRLSRINESIDEIPDAMQRRLVYAKSEFSFVSATYYYYVGQITPFRNSLNDINPDDVERDTAQYLGYLYNMGAGDAIVGGNSEKVQQTEFDYLMRCFLLAVDGDYPFWEAQSLQALSEHLQNKESRKSLIEENATAMKFLNVDFMPDGLLAGNLAQRSLNIFIIYGDPYQIAGANRTLGTSFRNIGDYQSSLICLKNALNTDSAIVNAPDLVASIREQLCITYSALDDKQSSDFNRNIYLDLQEETRQDRMLESRASQLDTSIFQLNLMIGLIIILIITLIVLLFLFGKRKKHHDQTKTIEALLLPLQEWKTKNDENFKNLDEEYEDIHERRDISELHIMANKKRSLEQRAKVSLVNSVIPFIDRMINEVSRLYSKKDNDKVKHERYEYLYEITNKINEYNGILTQWIQMRQGELSLHIESFPLKDLLDIVSKGRMGYNLQGIELDIADTDVIVKADRTLTLFMINTIADNARKFTSRGGHISIEVKEVGNDYVDISVIDDGSGMSEDQVAHVFDRTYTGGHGFGLLNCKGIIDKYKKISPIFRDCYIRCESVEGKGSKFSFSLPKGRERKKFTSVLKIFLPLLLVLLPLNSDAQIGNAVYFADRAYQSNIASHYDSTLLYVDSALMVVKHTELKNKNDSSICSNVLLSVYNEGAVSALAKHNWKLYEKYNSCYTTIFNNMSADKTLGSYVRQMQQSENNKNVAIVILILLLLLIIPFYYFFYYRHQVYYQYCVGRIDSINKVLIGEKSNEEKLHIISQLWDEKNVAQKSQQSIALVAHLSDIVKQIKAALSKSVSVYQDYKTNIELAKDELDKTQYEDSKLHVSNAILDNCLSTLKHETMYYPSRIAQLIDGSDENLESISELVKYYKDLYGILSAQAMLQVESVRIRPDADMLTYLFELLSKECGEKSLNRLIKEKDESYVIITVLMPNLELNDAQLAALFTVQTYSLDMLLCRQIVRDFGEMTNLRGCGISGRRNDKGQIEVVIILPKKICKNLK